MKHVPITKLNALIIVGSLSVILLTGAAVSNLNGTISLENEISSMLLIEDSISVVDVKIMGDDKIYIRLEPKEYSFMTNKEIDHYKSLVAERAGVREGYVVLHDTSMSAQEMKNFVDKAVEEITEIPLHREEDFTHKEWESLMKKAEKGEVKLLEYSPEKVEFIEFCRYLDKVPTIVQNHAETDRMDLLSYEERTAIYQYYNDYGNDAIFISGTEDNLVLSCYHLETGELMVTENRGQTWIAKDHILDDGSSRLEQDYEN